MPGIRETFSRFRGWIENMASKGMGADRVYRQIREYYNLGLGQRSPIPRRFVRDVLRLFRPKVLRQQRTFPKRSDAILGRKRAIPINTKSPLGNRFQVIFEFEVINPVTGQRETQTQRIGLPREVTLGEARAIAQRRLDTINNKDFIFDSTRLAQLQREDFFADVRSIRFIQLFEHVG